MYRGVADTLEMLLILNPSFICSAAAVNGEFELRHWISPPERKASLRRRESEVPAAIEIPNGRGGGDASEFEFGRWRSEPGYTSLRDILTSPEYAASRGLDSPMAGGGSCGEIRIRNPLVKHAAYAYLQMTPSGLETTRRRRSGLCRFLVAMTCGGAEILAPCAAFLGGLFHRLRR